MIQLAKIDLRSSIKTQIVEMIKKQGLKPGDKIVSQNELEKLLKVGASTIFRVLRELTEDGILYRIQGKGTFVAEPLQIPETKQPVGEFTVGIYPFENFHGNDYLSELVEGISQGIMRHHFNCKYITRSKFEHSNLSISKYMFIHQIDGIIMNHLTPKEFAMADELRDNGFPCVLINRHVDGCDTVNCNHYAGTKRLMEILFEHGHERIFYIGTKSNVSAIMERLNSYVDFCRSHNIYDENLVFLSDANDNKSEEKAMKLLLAMKNSPTAVVVASGNIRGKFIKLMLDNGISIPEDISVIAYDALYLPPKYGRITCIKQPLRKMGTVAVDIINKNLHFNINSAININFDTELIQGNSVAVNKFTQIIKSAGIYYG